MIDWLKEIIDRLRTSTRDYYDLYTELQAMKIHVGSLMAYVRETEAGKVTLREELKYTIELFNRDVPNSNELRGRTTTKHKKRVLDMISEGHGYIGQQLIDEIRKLSAENARLRSRSHRPIIGIVRKIEYKQEIANGITKIISGNKK